MKIGEQRFDIHDWRLDKVFSSRIKHAKNKLQSSHAIEMLLILTNYMRVVFDIFNMRDF